MQYSAGVAAACGFKAEQCVIVLVPINIYKRETRETQRAINVHWSIWWHRRTDRIRQRRPLDVHGIERELRAVSVGAPGALCVGGVWAWAPRSFVILWWSVDVIV